MSKPRNVIVLIADSLRWDSVHLGDDPRLPYTAARAVRFDQARSGGCWTLPATASMFTGLMPHQHGATSQTRGVRKDVPVLSERMKALGYSTHMVTANVATTHIFGLDRGFDTMDRIWDLVDAEYKKMHQIIVLGGKPRLRQKLFSKDFLMGRMSEDLDASKTWLQSTMNAGLDRTRELLATNEANGKQSFFFVNLMETHFPYHVDDTFRCVSEGAWGKLVELYNLYHLINQTWLTREDGLIKPSMLDLLRLRQRLAWERMAPAIDAFIEEMREKHDALVVFGSDHGDNFGEQGWAYHFSNVNDAGNRVPLYWLHHDRDDARIVSQAVSARDLYGSILRAAGDPDPSLVSLVHKPDASIPVMQSYWYNARGKTLPQFMYNQFAFVSRRNRYVHRKDRWYAAPITEGLQTEPAFEALDRDVDPLQETFVGEPGQLDQLRRAFHDFEGFSARILPRAA